MSSTNAPLFSVVMATYGRGRHILPSVRSVLAQNLDDFELLVVGDCCDDETDSVLAPMLCERVRWSNLPVRSGSRSAASNEGIRMARGRLIAYIGHDDIWEPFHLSSLARLFAQDPTLDFGISGAIYHLPHGMPGSLVTGMFVDDSAKHVHFFPASSLAHRAAVTAVIGPWCSPETTIASADCDLIQRATASDLRFASTRHITTHKFAACHRYLSHLMPESHEQEAMFVHLGTRGHSARVEMILAQALVNGTYMSTHRDSDDHGEDGAMWCADRTHEGMDAADVQPLGERLVVRQSPSRCALDWENDVVDGLRWSLRSPQPRVLVPVTAKGPVRLDLELAHDDPAVLAAFTVCCNGEPASVQWCAVRQPAAGPARALLSMRLRLREGGPSVLELHLPESLRPAPRRRGIAIGEMTLYPARSETEADGHATTRQPLPETTYLPNWRTAIPPDEVRRAKTMLMPTEQQLLHSLARDYFRNEGVIVDAGCFLGGSTLALASGLRDNPRFQAAPRNDVIHTYDLFAVEPWTIGIYFPEDTAPDTSFEATFRDNIAPFADLVAVHSGDVSRAPVPNASIEILFIDLAKHWKTNDHVVRAFFPKLIPGRSLIIQQDYLYQTGTGWLPVTMEYFSEYFEIVDHTELNSVVFLYTKAAPPEAFAHDVIQSLTRSQMRRLADRAISRFKPPQQKILRDSRDQFQAMLHAAGWRE